MPVSGCDCGLKAFLVRPRDSAFGAVNETLNHNSIKEKLNRCSLLTAQTAEE
jgi:hypothetical protein